DHRDPLAVATGGREGQSFAHGALPGPEPLRESAVDDDYRRRTHHIRWEHVAPLFYSSAHRREQPGRDHPIYAPNAFAFLPILVDTAERRCAPLVSVQWEMV